MFTTVSEDQEYAIGAKAVQSAIKEEGLYKEDEALYDYYKVLGMKLEAVTERQEKPLEFLMLDSPTYNAWATPGYVNIYRGILPYFNSEAELVAVMAHEAGHINARHTARQITKGTLAQILVTGAAIYAGSQTDSSEVANLAGVVAGVGATLAMQGYSRSYEREADDLALRYMGKMGYDAREAHNVFRGMAAYHSYYEQKYALFNDGKIPPKSPFYHLLLSHPEPKDRMAQVAETVGLPDGSVRLPTGVQPATPQNDPQGRTRYLKQIDGISVGPKPDNGVATRTHFYHEKHRFKWQLPKGTALDWTGQNWEGVNIHDKTKIKIGFATAEKDDPDFDPEEALRQLFPRATDVEKASVGGRTAYTAVAGSGQERTRIVVLHSGKTAQDKTKGRHFIVLTFEATAEKDADIRTSLNHFTYLTLTQAEKIQPLRLRAVTVKKGDTLDSLANRMATNVVPKQWFMAINGVDENTPLISGMQVKLVVNENTL